MNTETQKPRIQATHFIEQFCYKEMRRHKKDVGNTIQIPISYLPAHLTLKEKLSLIYTTAIFKIKYK